MLKLFSSPGNRSIKTQVISFMVVSLIFVLTLTSFITTKMVSEQYREIMLSNAVQITQGLAKQSVFPLLSASQDNTQPTINQIINFESVVAARLLFEDKKTFVSSGTFPKQADTNQIKNNKQLAIKEAKQYWLIQVPVVLQPVDYSLGDNSSSVQPTNTQQIIGYAEVVYSKTELKNAQLSIAKLSALVGFISLVVLAIILRTGLSRLFMPIKRLSEVMDKTKHTGDYVIANTDGAKEVRNIASAYNNMMRVLNDQEIKLKQHRDQLEEDVKMRTSALVLARDAALTASRHKSEFIANISHELRTPIQSIIGYGELVTEELELAGNFDVIDDMDKINTNSQRLLNLINSLLDLAKIEAGKIELQRTTVNLTEMIKQVSDTITPLALRNHNHFRVTNDCKLPQITIDKEKFEQVLLNLLSNACKFTEHGEVSLAINNDHQYLYFLVSDTGIGLNKEQQLYIFDEFRQVDSSQARKFSGTGLGLAISKRFIELMRGKIVVVSEEGKGATFTVMLPYKETTQ